VRLFLDTANIDEIREIHEWGILKGVTTNPTLLAREHDVVEKAWRTILELVDGDVSLETTEPTDKGLAQFDADWKALMRELDDRGRS